MPPRLRQMLGCFVLSQDQTFPRGGAELILHLVQRFQPLRYAVRQVIAHGLHFFTSAPSAKAMAAATVSVAIGCSFIDFST